MLQCVVFGIVSLFFKKYKKFWEELIAYFPLIRHGPHKKQNNLDTQIDRKVISQCTKARINGRGAHRQTDKHRRIHRQTAR
jgi:hypothetical protein